MRPRSKTNHYMLTWGDAPLSWNYLQDQERAHAILNFFTQTPHCHNQMPTPKHTDNALSQPNACPKAISLFRTSYVHVLVFGQSASLLSTPSSRSSCVCHKKCGTGVSLPTPPVPASFPSPSPPLAPSGFEGLPVSPTVLLARSLCLSRSLFLMARFLLTWTPFSSNNQTNEGLGSPPDSLSQSSCQQQLDWCLTCA